MATIQIQFWDHLYDFSQRRFDWYIYWDGIILTVFTKTTLPHMECHCHILNLLNIASCKLNWYIYIYSILGIYDMCNVIFQFEWETATFSSIFQNIRSCYSKPLRLFHNILTLNLVDKVFTPVTKIWLMSHCYWICPSCWPGTSSLAWLPIEALHSFSDFEQIWFVQSQTIWSITRKQSRFEWQVI